MEGDSSGGDESSTQGGQRGVLTRYQRMAKRSTGNLSEASLSSWAVQVREALRPSALSPSCFKSRSLDLWTMIALATASLRQAPGLALKALFMMPPDWCP